VRAQTFCSWFEERHLFVNAVSDSRVNVVEKTETLLCDGSGEIGDGKNKCMDHGELRHLCSPTLTIKHHHHHYHHHRHRHHYHNLFAKTIA